LLPNCFRTINLSFLTVLMRNCIFLGLGRHAAGVAITIFSTCVYCILFCVELFNENGLSLRVLLYTMLAERNILLRVQIVHYTGKTNLIVIQSLLFSEYKYDEAKYSLLEICPENTVEKAYFRQ
jgi:hypothetical protein